ncbi:MAG: type VI secretion system baseplate subunit TssK [Aquisalimonadaceae bacterium]
MENKTAWLESQYLFPHHFQQQERYIEQRIEQRCAAISPYRWGFNELVIDHSTLVAGKVALSAARGVMPDGTPFHLPYGAPLPTALDVPAGSRDTLLYLVIPDYQPGARYLDAEQAEAGERIARYRLKIEDVFDYTGGSARPERIETAVLNCSLALQGDDLGGYTRLPIARVREVTQEGAVVLDTAFIPTVLEVAAHRRLKAYLADVRGLLQQRGEALALRFTESGKTGGSSAIADFLLLQLINRYEPRLRHLGEMQLLHPERLYCELAGLMGELATFTTESKRPVAVPGYRHDDLYASFQPLNDVLGRELSAVLEQTAISLPVEDRQYGIRVARISDRALLKQARFVLAVKADLPTESVREQMPALIKVGAVETIRDLVNNQLPGIEMNALPVAPREVPYHAGCVYFELDGSSDQWQALKNSGGFAFHIAGDLPNLKLEFWAIRD